MKGDFLYYATLSKADAEKELAYIRKQNEDDARRTAERKREQEEWQAKLIAEAAADGICWHDGNDLPCEVHHVSQG